jgi:hypothetical protein
MKAAVAAAVVALELITAPAVSAQSPRLDELMRRVGAYVTRFVSGFSNVVAEEDYNQAFKSGPGRRRLKSDFLLVGYPGDATLVMTFRDVREVDGKTVADKEERITELFLRPFDSAVTRARDIHRAGLRYNLPNARLGDPLAVLVYLQPAYQKQFRFSRAGLDRKLGKDVREINMIQVGARGVPIQARAWVSEASGEVVKTELTDGFGPRATVTTTTFTPDAALGLWVPAQMRDVAPLGFDEFTGTASYTNVRRFQVRTESQVGETPPANPR